MPKKSDTAPMVLGGKSDYDYQCEEDVRTLNRAAEMMADKGRAKAALGKFKKQRHGMDALVAAFSPKKAQGY